MNILQQTATLELQAQSGEVRRATAWLHAEGQARAVPDEVLARLDICLHEALANVLDHGGLPAAACITLLLRVQDSHAMLTLCDGGLPFDPTLARQAPFTSMLEQTQPGGLGLVMLRANAGQLDYRHDGGCNHLTVTVSWSAA